MEENNAIYTERQIQAGTFVGGPLAAGYLLAKNFKAFNEKSRARTSYIISVVATLFILGGLSVIPGTEKIPNAAVPVIYVGIVIGLVKLYQSQNISEHTGPTRTWANTLLVSFGFLIITLFPVFGVAYLLSASGAGSEKTYGRLQHDIYFDRSNISEAEVDKIADVFTKLGFFDEELKKSVDVRKEGNKYQLSIYCNETARNNPEVVQYFTAFRSEIQKSFPNNPVILLLVIGTPDDVVARIQ